MIQIILGDANAIMQFDTKEMASKVVSLKTLFFPGKYLHVQPGNDQREEQSYDISSLVSKRKHENFCDGTTTGIVSHTTQKNDRRSSFDSTAPMMSSSNSIEEDKRLSSNSTSMRNPE